MQLCSVLIGQLYVCEGGGMPIPDSNVTLKSWLIGGFQTTKWKFGKGQKAICLGIQSIACDTTISKWLINFILNFALSYLGPFLEIEVFLMFTRGWLKICFVEIPQILRRTCRYFP
jgi:hypothetical protein